MSDTTDRRSGGYIYRITNSRNGKVYIGQTRRTVPTRFAEHLRDAFAHNYDWPLYQAIREYGPDTFVVETVAEAASNEVLNDLEVIWILDCGSLWPGGYNKCLGGQASEETIARRGASISAAYQALMGTPRWDAILENRRVGVLRACSTPEFGKKMQTMMQELGPTPGFRAKVRNGIAPILDARNAAIAAAWTPEKRKATGRISKDRASDPTVRLEMGAAIKAAHARPEVKRRVIAAQLIAQRNPETNRKRGRALHAFWEVPQNAARRSELSTGLWARITPEDRVERGRKISEGKRKAKEKRVKQ